MTGAGAGPRVLEVMALSAGVQARVAIDEEVVLQYAELLASGTRLPPVTVFSDGDSMLLVDGHHRVEAARRCGQREVPADVRQGTQRDARFFALFKANRTHGLRMSTEDKRKAVREALADPEWAGWSDNRIAKEMGFSQPFVAKLRAEQIQTFEDAAPRVRTVERGGVVYHQDTSNIGRVRKVESDSTPEVDAAAQPATPAPPPCVEVQAPEGQWVPREGCWHCYADDSAAWHVVPVLGVRRQFWVSKLWRDQHEESYFRAPTPSLPADIVHEGLQCFGLGAPQSLLWLVWPHEGMPLPFGVPDGHVAIRQEVPFMEQLAAIPTGHPAYMATPRLLAPSQRKAART